MNVDILDAANALYSPDCDVYLPVLSVEGEKIKADGCAVFCQGKLSGISDQKTSVAVKAFHAPLEGGTWNVELSSGGTATLGFLTSRCDIIPEIQKDLPRFHISFSCKMRIEELHLPAGKRKDRQSTEMIWQAASDTLRRDLEETLDTVVRQYHADVVCFGRTLLRKETAWWVRHENDWAKIFPRVSCDVSVYVDLADEGSEISPDFITADLP